MLIQFNKNIQFTKLVKADGRLREFNFRKTNGMQGELFTVDVSDDPAATALCLGCKKPMVRWKIMDQQLPAWTIENEPGFHELIEEEMRYA